MGRQDRAASTATGPLAAEATAKAARQVRAAQLEHQQAEGQMAQEERRVDPQRVPESMAVLPPAGPAPAPADARDGGADDVSDAARASVGTDITHTQPTHTGAPDGAADGLGAIDSSSRQTASGGAADDEVLIEL